MMDKVHRRTGIRIRIVISTLALLLVSGCVGEYGDKISGATAVPLADVIKDPTAWDGKTVQVKGVFNWEFEGNALYLTNSDLLAHNFSHSVLLLLHSPDLRIPFEYSQRGDWVRRITTDLSLRLSRGRPAIATGVFTAYSPSASAVGYLAVRHLVLL